MNDDEKKPPGWLAPVATILVATGGGAATGGFLGHDQAIDAARESGIVEEKIARLQESAGDCKAGLASLGEALRQHEAIPSHPGADARIKAVEENLERIREDLKWIRRKLERGGVSR